MKQILIPTSGAVSAYESADYAINVARILNAHVHVLHVYPDEAVSEELDDALKLFQLASEEHGVPVSGKTVVGEVVPEIIRYAHRHDIDLILMGASEGEVVDEWVSYDVLALTPVPVLVMPYQVFDHYDEDSISQY